MNPSTAVAVAVAVPLVLLGLVSGAFQVRGLRRLKARTHVPSDEFGYLRSRHRRRLLAAGVMVVIGALIGGAYLSGMEGRADALGRPDPAAPRDEAGKRIVPAADRQFVRAWGVYWIGVIVLTFALIGIALVDAWATRRYWLRLYRQLRDDHQTRLRRDLAVYRQQHRRPAGPPGYGGRLGDG